MYTIDPTMSFAEVVLCYREYASEEEARGKKPVTFLRFITGRY